MILWSCRTYDNSAYSTQVSITSETVTATVYSPGAGLPPVPESHDDLSSSPPDGYHLYDGQKPSSSSNVTKTVSFAAEEKEQLAASLDAEKQPHPPEEHNGLPPQISSSDMMDHTPSNSTEKQPHPPAAETLEHNGAPPHIHTSADMVSRTTPGHGTTMKDHLNGTAGVGIDSLPTDTNASSDDKTREKVSPRTKKKGLRGLLGGKERPRRDSQKPLLNSQSSTNGTPGDRYEFCIFPW